MSETEGAQAFAINFLNEFNYCMTLIYINHSEGTAFQHVFKNVERIQ